VIERSDRARTLTLALKERRLLIAAVTLIVAFGTLAVSLALPDRYEGKARVLVGPAGKANATNGGADPERVAETNRELLRSGPVADRVRLNVKLNPRLSAAELRDRVEAERVGDTYLMDVRARDGEAGRAAAIANGFANQFAAYRRERGERELARAISLANRRLRSLPPEQRRGASAAALARRVRDLELRSALQAGSVEVVRLAERPSEPVFPRPILFTVLAVPAGLLIGLLLAALLLRFDRRLRREEQVEAVAGAEVIAAIPTPTRLTRRRGASRDAWEDSLEAEAYGRLASNLRFFNFDRQVSTVLIASAMPEEGKTTVVLRLAAALASAGHSVIAVEADLRRPKFAEQLGIQFPQGLSGVLARATPLDDAITRVHASYALAGSDDPGDDAWASAPYIDVMPGGVPPPNPRELVGSEPFRAVLEVLGARADFVLVDSPPLVPVGDAVPLADAADAALLVVRRGTSRRDEVRKALKSLGDLRSRVIGVVLTNAQRPRARYDYSSTKATVEAAAEALGPRRPDPRAARRDERAKRRAKRGTKVTRRRKRASSENGAGAETAGLATRSSPDAER
jgi:tyrosine-protein kinase